MAAAYLGPDIHEDINGRWSGRVETGEGAGEGEFSSIVDSIPHLRG